MATAARAFPFKDVVIIADIFRSSASNAPVSTRRDLEMTEANTFKAVQKAIADLGLTLHHYGSPAALGRNAWRHKEDIVLTLYGGQISRNRMALVPAICETYGLRFIGPDVYGRIVAQDKEISKRLAIDSGLRTPSWRIIRTEADLQRDLTLTFPVVVKPLFEGSSIGIAQRNKVTNAADATNLAREFFREFKQPILIEEFIRGREVAYTSIQGQLHAPWAFSEIVVEQNPSYFEERLFDADEKQNRTDGRTVRNIDSELSSNDREAIEAFLHSFGFYGYCRVDGRFAAGKFWLIELTPDAWLGPTGQFSMSFTEKGWSYTEIIAAVLVSAN